MFSIATESAVCVCIVTTLLLGHLALLTFTAWRLFARVPPVALQLDPAFCCKTCRSLANPTRAMMVDASTNTLPQRFEEASPLQEKVVYWSPAEDLRATEDETPWRTAASGARRAGLESGLLRGYEDMGFLEMGWKLTRRGAKGLLRVKTLKRVVSAVSQPVTRVVPRTWRHRAAAAVCDHGPVVRQEETRAVKVDEVDNAVLGSNWRMREWERAQRAQRAAMAATTPTHLGATSVRIEKLELQPPLWFELKQPPLWFELKLESQHQHQHQHQPQPEPYPQPKSQPEPQPESHPYPEFHLEPESHPYPEFHLEPESHPFPESHPYPEFHLEPESHPQPQTKHKKSRNPVKRAGRWIRKQIPEFP